MNKQLLGIKKTILNIHKLMLPVLLTVISATAYGAGHKALQTGIGKPYAYAAVEKHNDLTAVNGTNKATLRGNAVSGNIANDNNVSVNGQVTDAATG